MTAKYLHLELLLQKERERQESTDRTKIYCFVLIYLISYRRWITKISAPNSTAEQYLVDYDPDSVTIARVDC